jgi:hypothetical protein
MSAPGRRPYSEAAAPWPTGLLGAAFLTTVLVRQSR